MTLTQEHTEVRAEPRAVVGLAVGVLLFRLAWRSSNDRVRGGALTIVALAVLLNVWSSRPLMYGVLGMLVLVTGVELPDSWLGRHALIVLPILMWLWAN